MARRLAAHASSLDGAPRRALLLFSGWWTLLAANLILGGLLYVAEGSGVADLALHVTFVYVQRLLLAASLFCLLGYLTYLLVGRLPLAAIGAFYVAYYGWLVFTVASRSPQAISFGTWRTDLVYALDAPSAFTAITAVGLLVPPLVASVALIATSRKSQDPSRRYRGVLVGGALIAWWVVAFAAGAQLDAEPLQTINRFLGLVAAFVILAAYNPPAWARKRWGLAGFGESSATSR